MKKIGSFGAVIMFSTIFRYADAIYCYQCNSTQVRDQFQCGELFGYSDLQPQSCSNVYNAQYCVKQVGHLEVEGIKCYQCYAAFNISCSDTLIHQSGMEPQDCDYLFEAEYCVKTTGLFAGGLGTRRFCSSSDLGSYCKYVNQPGDSLPAYRSCFYTCTGDGCNTATTSAPAILSLVLLFIRSIL